MAEVWLTDKSKAVVGVDTAQTPSLFSIQVQLCAKRWAEVDQLSIYCCLGELGF